MPPMSDVRQTTVDSCQQMESRQFYISVSEGVYNSWRAVGVLEGLHSDGDIGHFLVTLYSSQEQGDGGGSSIRCVHCHCHLSLYCTTCHCPSHLALPLHPHHPPPSLTSPPSPHPLPVPLSSPPPPLPLQVLARSGTGDSESSLAPDLEKVVTNSSDIKDEVSDSTLPDEGDHDDSSFGLDTVKRESEFSIGDGDLKTTPPDTGTSVAATSDDERRKSHRLKRQPVTKKGRSKKKRAASVHRSEKLVKKKRYNRSESAADQTDIEGGKKTAHNIHLLANNPILKGTAGNVISHNAQKKTKRTAEITLGEKQNQREKKRKPCASQDLEDGFILPAEKRNSAQIHTYDESFCDNHKIEDEPPKRPGRPKKNVTKTAMSIKDSYEEQGRRKSTRRQRDSSTAAYSNGSSSSEEDVSNFQQDLLVEQNASFPEKDTGNENSESDKQPLRILVSGQKILALRTTTGNYAHNFYSYFECVHCKKAFVHKRAFNSHVQTHIEPKLHNCTVCGKGFKRSCDRLKHERRHNFECSICGKKYTDRKEFNEHLNSHTENNGIIKCSGCNFESSDFGEYKKHRSKCTVVQCEVCGVRLKSRFALRFHISAVHENDRPYRCTLCDKSFVLQTNLNSHMKYRHAEGGRTFHCNQCDYRAFDARALSIHQRCVHSSERPFKCTYCPSAFARKFYLVVHLRKHTGEKPHRCTECSQSFAQKTSLTRHRRTHHGLEPTANKAAELLTPTSLSC